MTSATPSTDPAADTALAEPLERFLGSFSETAVVFRYLDLLAERTSSLEQRIGLDELNQLRRENRALRERLKVLDAPDIELLALYLPIFYHNFWHTVGPEELAMHAGSQQMPLVPSPVEEPDEWRVLDMKRNFLKLSEQERAGIIDFCQRLPYPLRVRRSMKTLLEAQA